MFYPVQQVVPPNVQPSIAPQATPAQTEGMQRALAITSLAIAVISGIVYMATNNPAALATVIVSGISALWLSSSDPLGSLHILDTVSAIFRTSLPTTLHVHHQSYVPYAPPPVTTYAPPPATFYVPPPIRVVHPDDRVTVGDGSRVVQQEDDESGETRVSVGNEHAPRRPQTVYTVAAKDLRNRGNTHHVSTVAFTPPVLRDEHEEDGEERVVVGDQAAPHQRRAQEGEQRISVGKDQ